MLSVVWSLALGIVSSQVLSNEPADRFPREAVKLYRQALELADSQTPNLAFTVLEQICQAHPSSTLAAISALRIAEFRLAANDYHQSLAILLETIGNQSDVTLADVHKIDPVFESRLKALIQQIIYRIDSPAQLDALQNWIKPPRSNKAIDVLATSRPPTTQQILQAVVVDQVSLACARHGKFRQAIELLEQSPSPLTQAQQQAVQLDMPLALLKSKATKQDLDWLSARIASAKMPTSYTIALMFTLAEAQWQQGDINTAIKTLTDLSQQIRDLIASEASTNSDKINNSSFENISKDLSYTANTTGRAAASKQQLNDWLASATLRKAELLLLANQTDSAQQLSQTALSDFPQYTKSNQFRFLIARCQIAQVDFDGARRTLQPITESSVASSQPDAAQAWWMLGEIDFLQRNYRDAVQNYVQVLDIQTSTAWQARALLQAAKCYELLGSPQDALTSYQRISDQYPQSEVAVAAQNRIQQLTNSTHLEDSTQTQAFQSSSTPQFTSTISR